MHYGISNEESYEKDRSRLVSLIKEHINDAYTLDSLDLVEILELIEQSKWVRSDGNVGEKC